MWKWRNGAQGTGEKAGKGPVCFSSFAELNTELQLLHLLWEEKEEEEEKEEKEKEEDDGATECSTAQREKVLFAHHSHTGMPHQRDR